MHCYIYPDRFGLQKQNPNFQPSKSLINHTAINESQATLEGYVYHVKTLGGTSIGWIPQDTNITGAKLEYTLLIHPKSLYPDTTEDTTTVIHNTSSHGHDILIYPNPATNAQQLELNLKDPLEVALNLRSIDGSLVQSRSLGVLGKGRHVFTIELDGLPLGIYFHDISLGEEHMIKRFTHL